MVPGQGIIRTFTPEFGLKVVRITITENTPPLFATKMRDALDAISHSGLDYDFVDHGQKTGGKVTNEIISIPAPTTGLSKLNQAIQMLLYSFGTHDTRYKDGYVYSKVPGSVASYTEKITLRTYLGKNRFASWPELSAK